MAKLPFVVEPRLKPIIEEIGSEESGKIQIERRGYLTSGEKAFFQQAKQSDNGTTGLIGLARKVARATELDMTKAYEAIVRIIGGQASEEADKKIEDQFSDEISSVVRELTNGQTHDEILMAVCLIKYRIDASFELDEILSMHPDIISGLAELYRQEDAKSIDRLTDASKGEEQGIEKVAKKPISKVKPVS